MRIAILAHVRFPVARPFMGGMEAHCWSLAEGLSARGHDVTLFAAGDSDPRFRIDPVLPQHYERTFPWAEHRGRPDLIAHVDAGYAAALDRIARGGFDVLHNNSLHRFPLEPRRTTAVPTVTSLHVPPFDALHWFVKACASPTHRVTVTSASQMRAWWPAPEYPNGEPAHARVLHNGVDLDAWPFRACPGDGSAAWCGRVSPNKGTHLALDAARIAGVAVTLYGAIEDRGYWDAEVAPRLGEGARYGGHLSGDALAAALGRASVFLFTPLWDEPFGLVAAEAMACGLPVAATDMGAAREVVGEAGCLARPGDPRALATALRAAAAIPRTVPRARAERLFGRDRWLDGCEALYDEVVSARPRAAA